jgi:hypothetical protein
MCAIQKFLFEFLLFNFSEPERQGAGDIGRTALHSAYAGVPSVTSGVKEERDSDNYVKPTPLPSVDGGVYWMKMILQFSTIVSCHN